MPSIFSFEMTPRPAIATSSAVVYDHGAITAATGFELLDIPGVRVISDAGAAIGKSFSDAWSAVEAGWNKFKEGVVWVAGKAGEAGRWLWDHDPLMTFAARLANGEPVWDALKATGAIVVQDIQIFGPYLAFVPGIGTVAAMAIAAGVALANGKSLTELALETMRGAIPPGPMLAAFDIGNALLHGKGLDEAALSALEKGYPAIGAPVRAALALAKGESLSDATISALRAQLPEVARGAFDAGVSVMKGKSVQAALLDGVRGYLPASYQEVFDAARDIANGKNLYEVAINAVKRELPPAALPYATLGEHIIKGEKIENVLLEAAMAAIPGEYSKYFEVAMSLTKVDKTKAIASLASMIPPGTPASDVYNVALEIQGYAKLASAAARGSEAPSAAAGASFANEVLDLAIAEARTLLPDEPLARQAFDAAVQIVRGKSVRDVAAAVASSFVPAEYKATFDQAKTIADQALHGGNIGDIGIAALRAALPTTGPLKDAVGYFDLGIMLVKGDKVGEAAIYQARKAIPADVVHAFDAALNLAHGSWRAAVVDQIRSEMAADLPLDKVFEYARAAAEGKIPSSALEELLKTIPGTEAARAAFDQGATLAKGKTALEIGIWVAKSYIPAEYLTFYEQAAQFANVSNPAEVALNVLRSQVPGSAASVVDSTMALYQGKAPEFISQEPLTKTAVANVLEYWRALGKIPRILVSYEPSDARKGLDDYARNPLLAGLHGASAGEGITASAGEGITATAIGVSEGDLTAYHQAVEDIAFRRAHLGEANAYAGPALDPAFQKDIDARAAAIQNEERGSSATLPLLILGVAAVGGYMYMTKKK